MQQGAHPWPGRLGGDGQQILVKCVLQRCYVALGGVGADRGRQAGVGVTGDEFDPEAAGGQRPPERQPAGTVLGGGHVETQDLPVALDVDPDLDQGEHVDHPAAPRRPRAPGRRRRQRLLSIRRPLDRLAHKPSLAVAALN